ncbi:MAG: amidase [Pseudomonadota bacterium]
MRPLSERSALEVRAAIAQDETSARAYADALIDVVAAREPEIRAWSWFDPDHVRDQADISDRQRASGEAPRLLAGLPVGLKDVIDTKDIPTENGSAADRGRIPDADAWLVRALTEAGAVLMGKTVTTELAYMHAGPTRNPRNLSHSPGGSSSGSAAAVAAGMVPLAVGTQTGGSVIRPAAFCGIVGFKPSFGAIPRTGVLSQSPSLDTMGVFARNVADAALVADPILGSDPGDPASAAIEVRGLLDAVSASPGWEPELGFIRPPGWDKEASDETKAVLGGLLTALGDRVREVKLPPAFDDLVEKRLVINLYEMAAECGSYASQAEILGSATREALELGTGIGADAYDEAVAAQSWLRDLVAPILAGCDAFLCPAAPGAAPEGLASTGNSVFNAPWTFLGVPAITLPYTQTAEGLPLGVQLVAGYGADAHLLKTARWLEAWLADRAG